MLADALMLADDPEDGTTGYLIDRALDEAAVAPLHAEASIGGSKVAPRFEQVFGQPCKGLPPNCGRTWGHPSNSRFYNSQ
jgi:hypothetical protein